MKKQGFTLAETLITLGIIGICAALIAPSFRQLLPNKEKMEFMETYKLVTNALPVYGSYMKPEVIINHDGSGVIPKCAGWGCNNAPEGKFKELTQNRCLISIDTAKKLRKNNENYVGEDKNITVMTSGKVTCGKYSFELGPNATITDIKPEEAKKYLKDQFNYHKKGNEDEDK